jgi:hypothetical protein
MVSRHSYFLQDVYRANRRSADSIAATQDLVTFVAVCVYVMESGGDLVRRLNIVIVVPLQSWGSRGAFRPLLVPLKFCLLFPTLGNIIHDSELASGIDTRVDVESIALCDGPKGARDRHKHQH